MTKSIQKLIESYGTLLKTIEKKMRKQNNVAEDGSILSFSGDYRWMSNFWPSLITIGETQWPSVENAYQYSKFSHLKCVEVFLSVTPSRAKKIATDMSKHIRADWDEVKYKYMRKLQYEKYLQNYDLGYKLVQTGSVNIYEGNTWNDLYWGVKLDDITTGQNNMGKILMEVRDTLRSKGY